MFIRVEKIKFMSDFLFILSLNSTVFIKIGNSLFDFVCFSYITVITFFDKSGLNLGKSVKIVIK